MAPLQGTMKTWRITSAKRAPGEDTMGLRDFPVPDEKLLPPNHVIVRTRAVSVNYEDICVPYGDDDEGIPLSIIGKDIAPGSDFSGRIVAVHKSVTNFKPGQLVIGCLDLPAIARIANSKQLGPNEPKITGAWSEYIVANTQEIALVPNVKDLNLMELAAAPTPAITAYSGLTKYSKPGQHWLINYSTGGLGPMAIQIAKALGLTVTALCTERSMNLPRDLRQCKLVGADYIFQEFCSNPNDSISQDPKILKKGELAEFDGFIDSVGREFESPMLQPDYCRLKPDGTYLISDMLRKKTGIARIRKDAKADPIMSQYNFQEIGPTQCPKERWDLKLIEWLVNKKIKPIFNDGYTFDQIHWAVYEVALGGETGLVTVNDLEK